MRYKKPTDKNIRAKNLVVDWLSFKARNTRRVYLQIFNEFAGFLKSKALADATKEDAFAYVEYRKQAIGQIKGKVSNSTIRQKIRRLMQIYSVLIDAGMCEENPFFQISKRFPKGRGGDKRPTGMIAYDKVPLMINAFDLSTKEGVRNKAFMSLLFAGALRINEAIKLNLEDLKESESGTCYLVLHDTKNRTTVNHTIGQWAKDILVELYNQRIREGAKVEDPLLVVYKANTLAAQRISIHTAERIFYLAVKAAGITERVTPHFARATAITKLLDDGINYRDIREFSRHSSVSMVEMYDKRRLSIEENPGKNLSF